MKSVLVSFGGVSTSSKLVALANVIPTFLKTYQVGRKLSIVSVRQREDIVSYLE